jgi:peptide/nickel transport system ATP-binding protein
MESAPTDAFFSRPAHPYTRRLLESVPSPDGVIRDIPGEVPSLIDPPSGCRFHPRCERVSDACRVALPEAARVGAEHDVRCHHPVTAPVASGR